MEHVLRELDVCDLKVVYQPIVDLRTGEPFAYEALLRTSEPGQGPLQVIGRALDSSICGELGRVIRGLAVEGCPSSRLFLNIHPSELDEGWLVRPDDPIFNHEHEVFIEVTESTQLGQNSWCVGSLEELRGKGARLAVDDFGAGFSNLIYLSDLSPDIVKLDRKLIQRLHTDGRKQSIVRNMVHLCHELRARVVAEGIETLGELDAVASCGVDFAQGYLIGRPHELAVIDTAPPRRLAPKKAIGRMRITANAATA